MGRLVVRSVVRSTDVNTGEIKERSWAGVDRGWSVGRDVDGSPLAGEYYEDEWSSTPLEVALQLVPDLVAAIAQARALGMSLDVRFEREPG